MSDPGKAGSIGKPERLLALLAAAVCTLISAGLYSAFGQSQPMWPFPGLYLLEVISLTWVGAWVVRQAGTRSAAFGCAVTGGLTVFSILGVWSIGVFYLPVVLLSALAGGAAAWRAGLSALIALASFAAACAGQIVLMLTILRQLPSLTIFAAVHPSPAADRPGHFPASGMEPAWAPLRGRGNDSR